MGIFGSGKHSKNDVSDSSLHQMVHSMGAKSEEDFARMMYRESTTVPCAYCHREFPLDQIIIVCGEPYCKTHAKYFQRS